MKQFFILALMLTMYSCSKAQKTEFSKEALSENLESFHGQNLSFESIIENHNGKVVLIEIWASWCSDCVKAMPKLKELQSNFLDIDYVFISMDKNKDQWKNGIEKHELKGEHFIAKDQMKGNFAKAIDLNWIPRYIILDKTGKIKIYNAIETDFDKIHAALQELSN